MCYTKTQLLLYSFRRVTRKFHFKTAILKICPDYNQNDDNICISGIKFDVSFVMNKNCSYQFQK